MIDQSTSETALEKTAISMLMQKLDDSLIKQVTGLSDDELAKLKNQI
jgi:hypothetical protein